MRFVFRPATRRSTASRLRRDSEDSLSGAKEDLTKDMPNPPQPLKVEEVTKQLSQQSQRELGPSPSALSEGRGMEGCPIVPNGLEWSEFEGVHCCVFYSYRY